MHENKIKISISHNAVEYANVVALLAMVSWIISLVVVSISPPFEGTPFSFLAAALLTFVPLFVIGGIGDRIISVKATMLADYEKILFKNRRHREKIYFSDVKSISYSHFTEGSRYPRQWVTLYINTSDGTEHRFNDYVKAAELAAALDSNQTVPDIIRMYNFLAERMPDKAEGYKDRDDLM